MALALILSACGGGGGGGSASILDPIPLQPIQKASGAHANLMADTDVRGTALDDVTYFTIAENTDFSGVTDAQRQINDALIAGPAGISYVVSITDEKGSELDDDAHPF